MRNNGLYQKNEQSAQKVLTQARVESVQFGALICARTGTTSTRQDAKARRGRNIAQEGKQPSATGVHLSREP